jgi:hypothetical protein
MGMVMPGRIAETLDGGGDAKRLGTMGSMVLLVWTHRGIIAA